MTTLSLNRTNARPQRQDDTLAQILDLLVVADHHGLPVAVEWINSHLNYTPAELVHLDSRFPADVRGGPITPDGDPTNPSDDAMLDQINALVPLALHYGLRDALDWARLIAERHQPHLNIR